MNDTDSVVIGYMDMIDWECELGQAADGNRIFPSVETLKKYTDHNISTCGIVEVEVRMSKIIEHQSFECREIIRSARELNRKE